MMNLHPLTIEDKAWVDRVVSLEDSKCSDYSFVSVYLWDVEPSQVGDCAGRLALFNRRRQGDFFLYPIGTGNVKEAILALKQEADHQGIPFSLFGLTEEQKVCLETACPGSFEYREAPEYFDYIYSLEKMATLSGRKLHGKRNLIHQFEREYPQWELVELTREHLPACWDMQCRWMEGREEDEAAQAEQNAFSKAIEYYEDLGLEGVGLFVDGKLIAFAMGETIASDTYLIHFEKAEADIIGAYAMINREFARWVVAQHPELKYVNREDDLGYENLRKAKLSYYPEFLVKKYAAVWVKDGGDTYKEEARMNPYYPYLFEPLTIKKTTFRNRLFVAPHMMSHMDCSGRPDESLIDFFAEKAKGGFAVVTLGDTPVDREHGATNPRSFAITPENQPKLAEIARAIHAGGALASHELNHGGNVSSPEANYGDENWQAWGPVDFVRDWDGVQVHGMTEDEMKLVSEHYADCAEILKAAGYDMVLIHGGHGWLLDQFISPLYNTRTDEYGGSIENRAKFPLMVVDAVRQRCGEDFLIEYRMSGAEEIEGGLTKEEGIAFAKLLDGKVDLIHVSAGLDTEEAQAVHTHPTMFLPHGVNVHYAADIKAAGVKTPVVTIGGITTPELAESILAEGKADVISMARASIADPYFAEKARHGKKEDIVPCLRCLDCLTGLHNGNQLTCAVNCRSAQEARFDRMSAPAKANRKILVVGGGPGGLKAAATAAERGHQVTLAEATDKLGGLLKFTDYDDLKIDLKYLKDHLIAQVEKSGAEVLLNTTVTPEFIRDGGYDAVILAVGSTPAKPPIPGLDDPAVEHATTVYTSMEGLGKTVAVLGGGLVGCETGLYLAEHGHDITIIEMQSEIAPESNWMHKEGMMQSFARESITTRTGLRVSRVEAGKGVYAKSGDGEEVFIPADSVAYAMGMRPNAAAVSELRDVCLDTYTVGDCVRPRKARHAMEEGYWAAVNLG